MKKFKEKGTGYSTSVDEKKLIIQVPISTLVSAFNYAPDNYDGVIVKRGKRQAFAEFIAKHINDEFDSETGASYLTEMLDKMFSAITDGDYDIPELVKYPEEII